MSFVSRSTCSRIVRTNSSRAAGSGSSSSSSSTKPPSEKIGVRSSCEALAMNSLRALSSRASRRCISLKVAGQLADLVGALDRDRGGEVALGDLSRPPPRAAPRRFACARGRQPARRQRREQRDRRRRSGSGAGPAPTLSSTSASGRREHRDPARPPPRRERHGGLADALPRPTCSTADSTLAAGGRAVGRRVAGTDRGALELGVGRPRARAAGRLARSARRAASRARRSAGRPLRTTRRAGPRERPAPAARGQAARSRRRPPARAAAASRRSGSSAAAGPRRGRRTRPPPP